MKASSVILDALKDIDNTGTLEAEKKMTLHAGQDIRMTTGTHREENGQGHTTAIKGSPMAKYAVGTHAIGFIDFSLLTFFIFPNCVFFCSINEISII